MKIKNTSILVLDEFMNYCAVCGSPTTEIHHLIFGVGNRQKADEDGLIIPLCPMHHREGRDAVHKNQSMMMFSRQLGQIAFEGEYMAKEFTADPHALRESAREAFRTRYGQSYI